MATTVSRTALPAIRSGMYAVRSSTRRSIFSILRRSEQARQLELRTSSALSSKLRLSLATASPEMNVGMISGSIQIIPCANTSARMPAVPSIPVAAAWQCASKRRIGPCASPSHASFVRDSCVLARLSCSSSSFPERLSSSWLTSCFRRSTSRSKSPGTTPVAKSLSLPVSSFRSFW